jgi:2,4-dienoyl-CoA reductase (NADPH2)
VGLETALLLARKGTIDADTLYFLMFNQAETPEIIQTLLYRGLKKITVLEMLKRVGQDIGPSTRWTILQDLSRLGVRTLSKAQAKEITDRGVVMEREGREELIPGDTVVLATGAKPSNNLYDQIKGRVTEIHVIGDAKSPRKALEAVAEGLEVGRKI